MNKRSIVAGLLGFCIATPGFAQRDRSCDEEQQQALGWIQWAAERRALCRAAAGIEADQLACLQRAREQLAQAETEHAMVYSGQIRTLDPGHPMIKGLLAKLKDNVRAAEMMIASDAEPQQVAAVRKQTCMSRR